MSSTGRRLRESNEEISKYISQLREQRNELGILVDKQKIEKSHLEAEMARIVYKLSLINKSLNQRLRALVVYDETLAHIESKYKGLVDSTLVLLSQVRKESSNLESTIDKKIGTENDCPECPKCDISPLEYKEVSCNRIQEIPRESPIKQFIDNEKRMSRVDAIRSVRPSTDTEQLLYTRAMEYPMLLSPMMEKEHHDKLKTEMHGKQYQRTSTRRHSQSSNRNSSRIGSEATGTGNVPETVTVVTVEEQTEASSVSTSTKLSEANNSDHKSQPLSYSDVDFPDMEPNREVLEERNTTVEESESPVNSPDNIKDLAPCSFSNSESSPTLEKSPADVTVDQKESLDSRKHNSNNVDQGNLDIVGSNIIQEEENSEISTTYTRPKNYSGVEVFRQGYKSQHEKKEDPCDVNRHQRSIYNKKDFSFTIKK